MTLILVRMFNYMSDNLLCITSCVTVLWLQDLCPAVLQTIMDPPGRNIKLYDPAN